MLTPSEIYKTFWTPILQNREEILKAFVAKHGCEPDECVQVVQQSEYHPLEYKYFVRLRSPEEIQMLKRLEYSNPDREVEMRVEELMKGFQLK